MKYLLGLPKRINAFQGYPNQQLTSGPVNGSDPASFANAVSTGSLAGGIGLGAPTDQPQPGGQQYQYNLPPNVAAGLSGGYSNGAMQGTQQQGALSNMLMQQAQGQGPNPAQAMLSQATGQNVANQAALMAGQRGASANPALIAKQAAMTGANTMQQGAGQAAILGAQQQLAAQQQLGQLSQQQVGQQQQQNAQNIAMQGNINNANASMANAIQQARAGFFGGALQGRGAQMATNSQGTGSQQANQTSGNYMSQINAGGSGGINDAGGGGGGFSAAGSSASARDFATGGVIGPRSLLGQQMISMAKGGKVPAKVSPGEIYLPPAKAEAVASGRASPMSGERIPGKAKVKGDSLKNDTVDRNLEEGGVVIPRSKASKAKDAEAFVKAVFSRSRSSR